MTFQLDVINILILIVATINIIYGLIVFSRNRRGPTNYYFFLLTLTVSFWGISIFCYRGFESVLLKILFSKILYVSAVTIPFSFLIFVFKFTNTNIKKHLYFLLFIPLLIMVYFCLSPSGLIRGVQMITGHEDIIIFNRSLHLLYFFYIVSYFGASYFLLFRKLFQANGLYKVQLIYTIVGTLVSTTIGIVTNLTLPLFGIFSLNWMGQIGVVIMIVSISYAILKYNLFNIRLIATETFIASLWIFIFIRTFISENFNEQATNFILLILTIIFGVFLIRGVKKEIMQREKIEILAKELDKANERLKEFLSLATHQIRAPIAAIRGYASEILEGDFGKITDETRGGVEVIANSSSELAHTVQDFLDISRIEQNSMKYDVIEFDFNAFVKEIILELKPTIEKKKLTLNINIPDEVMNVKADKGKIQQVISNVIDNSTKYTPSGSITISTEKKEDKNVRVIVKDTGVGIKPETMSKLFQKFSRAEDATKANILGTGLGLYLARQLIEAQGGKIWAESEGDKKGSTFIIELPTAE